MKIAVVFDQFLYGGIERVGINHIKLLKELGHSVDAYVLNPRTEKMIEELKQECPVKIVPFARKLAPQAWWTITRRYKLGKYVFPFIYILLSFVVVIKKLIHKQYFKKYDLAIAFAGHFNDLTFVADNFLNADKKAAWIHGALYQFVLMSQGYEFLYKKIHNLVVLVDDAQEEVFAYHKKNGFDFNICKIYNPVCLDSKPVNKSYVNELKEKYGDFILMVSRMEYPHKDHYTVIEALNKLNTISVKKHKLVLVGDGPESEKLKSFCKQLNITDDVIFEGSKSNVQDYYSAASVLVHASIAGEGLPTILIEALGMGLPVVCTDSKVGPREILGDNKYGLLCKVKDPKDMAERLNIILSDNILTQQFIRDGKERYKDFSFDSVKDDLELFLKGLK